MLRIWIVFGLILLIGVALGLWLAARARRANSKAAGQARAIGPDDDPEFLRGLNPDGTE
jgi:hypothetical protein